MMEVKPDSTSTTWKWTEQPISNGTNTLNSRPLTSWRRLILGLVLAPVIAISVAVGEGLTISEFVASNNGGLQDEDGETSDWVEIHNPTEAAIDLAGWSLTDDADALGRWKFPSVSLDPDSFLIVFASGKDRAHAESELHANFKLSGDGEYLALVEPDGLTIAYQFAPSYPPQRSDISYGIHGAEGDTGFLEEPSPGEANGDGFAGFVADTKFSHDRGFYTEPIMVTITSDTPDAQIRYSLDGTVPRGIFAKLYTEPIAISKTTTLRAAATLAGHRPSNVDTQTYLFTSDIVTQEEMDTEVVEAEPYKSSLDRGLKAVPTLSLVAPDGSLFGSKGIYDNPGQRGIAAEREVSAEFFSADGSEEFQLNAGLRIHGADARNHKKKPFKLYFRSDYGEGRLRYPLFGDGVDEFDKLVLRGGGHEGWTSPYGSGTSAQAHSATFLRDQFLRQTHEEMGNLSPRGRPCHLYLNGEYWGLYFISERPDKEFGASHLGGGEDDYDVMQTSNAVVDGNKDDWNALQSLANDGVEDPVDYLTMLRYIDIDSLIDNMIVRIWSGDIDWLRSATSISETGNRNKNWYTLRRTRNGTLADRWQFFVWDGELSMGKGHRSNRNTDFDLSDVDIAGSPGRIYTALRENQDFQVLFADRLQAHFFNGGVMSPENNQARWRTLADTIRDAVVAESARWGDAQRGNPYTRDAEWEDEVQWMEETFMAVRNDIVLQQFADKNLYPLLPAPEFAVNGQPQHGGTLGDDALISIEGRNVYYTTDGTDPRQSRSHEVVLLDGSTAETRALVPSADNGGPALTLPEWTGPAPPPNDDAWRSGVGGVGYDVPDGPFASKIGVDLREMQGVNASAYVRVPFTLADQAALDSMVTVTLHMHYADGFIAYVNGVQVASRNAPDTPSWDAEATENRSDGNALEVRSFDISEYRDAFKTGANVLAIHVLNNSVTSNDLLALPGISYTKVGTEGIAPSAKPFTEPFAVSGTQVVKARSRNLFGSWSPLAEAHFEGEVTGSPGFQGDPVADNDKDGLSALLEYAIGTDDSVPNREGSLLELRRLASGEVELQFDRRAEASGIQFTIQTSSDLRVWSSSADFANVGSENLPNGKIRETYRQSATTSGASFVRLAVTSGAQ